MRLLQPGNGSHAVRIRRRAESPAVHHDGQRSHRWPIVHFTSYTGQVTATPEPARRGSPRHGTARGVWRRASEALGLVLPAANEPGAGGSNRLLPVRSSVARPLLPRVLRLVVAALAWMRRRAACRVAWTFSRASPRASERVSGLVSLRWSGGSGSRTSSLSRKWSRSAAMALVVAILLLLGWAVFVVRHVILLKAEISPRLGAPRVPVPAGLSGNAACCRL